MIELKRYFMAGDDFEAIPDATGKWVRFDAAQSELAALREELAESKSQSAEYGRAFNAQCRKTDSLNQHLLKATDFVERLYSSAGNQPSVATGYLRDILDALKPTESGASE